MKYFSSKQVSCFNFLFVCYFSEGPEFRRIDCHHSLRWCVCAGGTALEVRCSNCDRMRIHVGCMKNCSRYCTASLLVYSVEWKNIWKKLSDGIDSFWKRLNLLDLT